MRARQVRTGLVIYRPQGSEGLAKIVAPTFSEEPERLSGLRDVANARGGVEGDRLGRLSTWAPSPLAVTSSVGSFTRGWWQQANRRSGVGGLDAQAAYRLKSGAQRPRTLVLCFLADYLTEAIDLL